MNIQILQISSIRPYERNPRINLHAIEKVADSIREFGWQQPIVVDTDMTIIVGHTRYEAALKMGHTTVPVLIADRLTKEQAKAYRIADNKVAEFSAWDNKLLKVEFDELKEMNIDLNLTGFVNREIETIDLSLTQNKFLDTEPSLDKIKKLRQHYSVEPGQLWELGRHRILCGDSTNSDCASRLFKCVNNSQCLLMVTDPPYGVSYDADWRLGTVDKSDGHNAVGKVLNDDRADWRDAWILFNGDVAYVWHASINTSVVAESLQSAGFAMRSLII